MSVAGQHPAEVTSPEMRAAAARTDLQRQVGALSRRGPEPWTLVTYQNSWTTNASAPVQYYKDANNRVFLSGRASNGAVYAGDALSSQPFTLPAGYRPGRTIDFYVPGVDTTNGAGMFIWRIRTDGTVRLAGGQSYATGGHSGSVGSNFTFEPVSFRAEQ